MRKSQDQKSENFMCDVRERERERERGGTYKNDINVSQHTARPE